MFCSVCWMFRVVIWWASLKKRLTDDRANHKSLYCCRYLPLSSKIWTGNYPLECTCCKDISIDIALDCINQFLDDIWTVTVNDVDHMFNVINCLWALLLLHNSSAIFLSWCVSVWLLLASDNWKKSDLLTVNQVDYQVWRSWK